MRVYVFVGRGARMCENTCFGRGCTCVRVYLGVGRGKVVCEYTCMWGGVHLYMRIFVYR